MSTKFYTNMYPVTNAVYVKDNDYTDLPVGTVFTVVGIMGDSFELKPVTKVNGMSTIPVGCQMLNTAFTETDYID